MRFRSARLARHAAIGSSMTEVVLEVTDGALCSESEMAASTDSDRYSDCAETNS